MNKNGSKKIIEKIENIINQLGCMMSSRLFIALFMIIDGISFMINPKSTMRSMAQTVALCAFIASSGILITTIKTDKRNIKTIIMTILMMIICVFVFINPKFFAQNLRILLAIFIILNGLINIFNILKLDKISSNLTYTENQLKNKFTEGKKQKEFDKEVILTQTGRLVNPVINFIEQASGNTILYLMLNIISVILGIFVFIADDVSFLICGIILIYTGIFDLLIFIRAKNLSRKAKNI